MKRFEIKHGSIAAITYVNGDAFVFFESGKYGAHNPDDKEWQALPALVRYVVAKRFEHIFAVEGAERAQRVEELQGRDIVVSEHNLVDETEVPADILASEFDYVRLPSNNFFQHAGEWYHLDQFSVMSGKDGIAALGTSAFSAVIVGLTRNCEAVHCAVEIC